MLILSIYNGREREVGVQDVGRMIGTRVEQVNGRALYAMYTDNIDIIDDKYLARRMNCAYMGAYKGCRSIMMVVGNRQVFTRRIIRQSDF